MFVSESVFRRSVVEPFAQSLAELKRLRNLAHAKVRRRSSFRGFVASLQQQQQQHHHRNYSASDGDVDSEVERLVSLGARRVRITQSHDVGVVLADPDGNQFCVQAVRPD